MPIVSSGQVFSITSRRLISVADCYFARFAHWVLASYDVLSGTGAANSQPRFGFSSGCGRVNRLHLPGVWIRRKLLHGMEEMEARTHAAQTTDRPGIGPSQTLAVTI